MKTLIVYYTLEGNTHYAAKKIASKIGADVLRIKPVKTYPKKGFRKFFWGGKSAVMAETPELEPLSWLKRRNLSRTHLTHPLTTGSCSGSRCGQAM